MSTATIYADRPTSGNPANDEATGVIGGHEPTAALLGVQRAHRPRWEAAQMEAALPATRRVALRTAMVMSPDRGGVFDVLLRLARLGLGGPVAGGGSTSPGSTTTTSSRAVELLLERRTSTDRSTWPRPSRCRSAS